MFHRVKSEAPPPQPQQSAPAQTTPQTPPRDEGARYGEFAKHQNPVHEQNRNMQPVRQEQAQPHTPPAQAQQPPAKQQQEDAPAMTNPTQNTSQNTNAGEDFSAPRALDAPASPYARPGAAPVRSGPGYPGVYPAAAAYPARGAAATPALTAGERKLVIGRGISISGEIESCDHLVVEGTVEAALKGASVLEIAEGGTFYGTVDIDEATVAGRFEGDLTVHGRLNIRSTGTITGSIAYKEFEAEAGAVIDGRLTPVGSQNDARNKSQNKTTKKESGKNGASNDGELFSAKNAAE